ncbi:hypothetical protein ACMXYX_17690 (plasmid) [Neptuniibacter sp. QD72_48]|uniref:hypothetical protein n=1 Tax=Neptuniibacter sp. QD72_48 TaxID=3398214 RepID=UPI0039F4BE43
MATYIFDEYVRAGDEYDDHCERLEDILEDLLDLSIPIPPELEGKLTEAELEEYKPLSGESEDLRSHIGRIYSKSGQDIEAVEAFAAAIKEKMDSQREQFDQHYEQQTAEDLAEERLEQYEEDYFEEHDEYPDHDLPEYIFTRDAIVERAEQDAIDHANDQVEIENFTGDKGKSVLQVFGLGNLRKEFDVFYKERQEEQKRGYQAEIDQIHKGEFERYRNEIRATTQKIKDTDYETEALLKYPEQMREREVMAKRRQNQIDRLYEKIEALNKGDDYKHSTDEEMEEYRQSLDKKAVGLRRAETILGNKVKTQAAEKFWKSKKGQKLKSSMRTRAAWSAFRARQAIKPDNDVRPTQRDYDVAYDVLAEVVKKSSDPKNIKLNGKTKEIELKSDTMTIANMRAVKLTCNALGLKKIPVKAVVAQKKATDARLKREQKALVDKSPTLRETSIKKVKEDQAELLNIGHDLRQQLEDKRAKEQADLEEKRLKAQAEDAQDQMLSSAEQKALEQEAEAAKRKLDEIENPEQDEEEKASKHDPDKKIDD